MPTRAYSCPFTRSLLRRNGDIELGRSPFRTWTETYPSPRGAASSNSKTQKNECNPRLKALQPATSALNPISTARSVLIAVSAPPKKNRCQGSPRTNLRVDQSNASIDLALHAEPVIPRQQFFITERQSPKIGSSRTTSSAQKLRGRITRPLGYFVLNFLSAFFSS